MKLSDVLFVALVASVCAVDEEAARQEEEIERYRKCLDKYNISMSEIQKTSQDNKPNPKDYCLIGCSFVAKNLLKEDGSVNKKTLNARAKELAAGQKGRAAGEAFKKCFDFKEKLSLCEIGRVASDCLKKLPH